MNDVSAVTFLATTTGLAANTSYQRINLKNLNEKSNQTNEEPPEKVEAKVINEAAADNQEGVSKNQVSNNKCCLF